MIHRLYGYTKAKCAECVGLHLSLAFTYSEATVTPAGLAGEACRFQRGSTVEISDSGEYLS